MILPLKLASLLFLLVATPVEDTGVEALTLAVAAGQEPAATNARVGLKGMGPSIVRPILAVSGSLRGDERARVISLLSQFGEAAYEELRDAGADEPGPGDERLTLAIAATAAMGERIIPIALKELRKTPGSRGQGFAAQVLQSQGRLPVGSLIEMADDPSAAVRQSVVGLLGLARDSRAAGTLVRIASAAETSAYVRALAIEGLVRLQDDSVLPIAKRGIHDGDDSVRGASAVALGRLLPPEESRARLAFLSRSDPEISVRSTAAKLLGDSREPISIALGQRYNPVSTSPLAGPALERRRILFAVITGLAVLGLSVAGHRLASRTSVLSVALARNLIPCILLLGVGWVWGRWVNAIYWRTEYQFVGAALGGICIPRGRLRLVLATAPRWLSRLWLGHLAAVFSGYLLGWTQLWGWSFEWLDLFRLWRQGSGM